ncbi:MAG: exopolyphosphatase/guanosine-5'-triphosphate,3'-diphosphate pyrophosphatase [Cognaticolwellia sp.]|jgi:exopolyphosphatase/guanosine-5'-triphosphate,3'-diphosphate pyrophosphatase
MTTTSMETSSPLYAVVDLGSNSFHMLLTRQLADSVQVVDKVKRKVRLAAGLSAEYILSEQAMAKGLECLSFFAERLQDIPKENIRIVATATLRLAHNRADFMAKAEKVLGHKITLLSGIAEAKHIYLGVAHTSYSADKRLVLDIGGASTEIIVGRGFRVKQAHSFNLGCVTYNQQYFPDGMLTAENFANAISAAEQTIATVKAGFCDIGWQCVLGGSGTMQALAEMLIYQHKPSVLSLDFLYQVQKQLQTFEHIKDINLPGLSTERSPVIASGLAILIALFQQFSIQQLTLSSGALREGLLYEMLPNSHTTNIRQRTIQALSQRFHIDQQHADSVKRQICTLFSQLKSTWHLPEGNALELLLASGDLHEIGLLLEYKYHQQHSAYILTHADLAGFSQSDRQLLVSLVTLYKGDINQLLIEQQSAIDAESATKLLIILRLAVKLCRRRKDDKLPNYHIKLNEKALHLSLPKAWLMQHALIYDELKQENDHIARLGYRLHIDCENELSVLATPD